MISSTQSPGVPPLDSISLIFTVNTGAGAVVVVVVDVVVVVVVDVVVVVVSVGGRGWGSGKQPDSATTAVRATRPPARLRRRSMDIGDPFSCPAESRGGDWGEPTDRGGPLGERQANGR